MFVQAALFISLLIVEVLGVSLQSLSKRQQFPGPNDEQILGPEWDPFKPSYLSSTRREEKPSNFKVKGAKHLTLWYKTFELEKQTNPDILQDASFYDTWYPSEPPMAMTGNWAFIKTMLADFPTNITILRGKLSLVDENDNPVNISTGIASGIAQLADEQTMMNLLMACRDNRYILPWFPHIAIEATKSSGPELFTNQDGSDPNIGWWSRKLYQTMELAVQVVNLDPIRNKTIVAKIDLDFMEGRPRRLSHRMPFWPSACDKEVLVKDPNGGPKSYIYKTKEPMTFRLSGKVFSIQPIMPYGGTETKIKINGKEMCTSVAEYIMMPPSSKLGSKQIKSLLSMSQCNQTFNVSSSDVMELEQKFDFETYPLSEIMEKTLVLTGQLKDREDVLGSMIYLTFARKDRSFSEDIEEALGLPPGGYQQALASGSITTEQAQELENKLKEQFQ